MQVYMDRIGGEGASQFQDLEFPANAKTVGPIHGLSPSELQKQLVWWAPLFPPLSSRQSGQPIHLPLDPEPSLPHSRGLFPPRCRKRVADVVDKGTQQTAGTKLFADGILPEDICQGQVGDCWLLSTLACLAGRKGAIEYVFITAEVGGRGHSQECLECACLGWVGIQVSPQVLAPNHVAAFLATAMAHTHPPPFAVQPAGPVSNAAL
jgi:hypothetical protein